MGTQKHSMRLGLVGHTRGSADLGNAALLALAQAAKFWFVDAVLAHAAVVTLAAVALAAAHAPRPRPLRAYSLEWTPVADRARRCSH